MATGGPRRPPYGGGLLRSYEDLLGITRGGTDGLGHLGFAAASGLAPFGRDVFNRAPFERER